jgi:hypothetical protein
MIQCVSSATSTFSDGFENSLNNWTDITTNPAPSVTTEQKYSGSYSLKAYKTESGGSNYVYKAYPVETRLMYFQAYARLSAPTVYGDNRFMVCADKNSNFIAKISIYYDKTSSPKLHLVDAIHDKAGVYSIAWTPNTWHSYTVMIDATSQGSISVWYDGSFVGSLTGDFSSVATLGTLIVGSHKSDQAVTNYIDNVSMSTTSPLVTTPPSITGVTYFKSTFSYASTGSYAANQNWPSTEPAGYKIEKGTWNWVNTGDTANMKLVVDPATGNSYCLKMVLDRLGTRPLSVNQQAKLYNIPSRETSNWNGIQDTKEVYYTMKYWFPSDFSIARYSWRLIWQLNGEANVYGNPQYTYSPQMALIFGDKDLELQASGYYYKDGQSREYSLINNVDIPKGQWVEIAIYVKQGSSFRTQDGTVTIWINDKQVFSSNTMSTSTVSGTPYAIWSIANYGGPYEAQNQYFLIKDVMATSYLP